MTILALNQKFSLSDALVMCALGIAVVFAVLVLLMVVIYIMSLFFKKDKKTEPAPAAAVGAPVACAPAAPAAPGEKLARGSCGGIKLHGVPDKTAAMLMAIVADKLSRPLNELHFISIKEIKEKK